MAFKPPLIRLVSWEALTTAEAASRACAGVPPEARVVTPCVCTQDRMRPGLLSSGRTATTSRRDRSQEEYESPVL